MKQPIRFEPLPAPRVEIINLIDVLMTLIAFFLLTTVFIDNQRWLGLNLPVASRTEAPAPGAYLRLELTKTNQLFFNGNPVNQSDLEMFLKKYSPESPVALQADADCKYQWIISLLDKLKQAGFRKVAFGVKER